MGAALPFRLVSHVRREVLWEQALSKDTKPTPKPAAPPVRFLRLFRGTGDMAPYLGVEELSVVDGKPVRKVLHPPDVTDITIGKLERAMLEDVK